MRCLRGPDVSEKKDSTDIRETRASVSRQNMQILRDPYEEAEWA